MNATSTGFAIVGVFVVADLVYALDHYFVHHDPARYRATHSRHHRRYNGQKDGPQLDRYELSTYGTAAVMSMAGMSVLSLFTGNPGFLLGAVLKFVHTLLFHLYQHRWWSAVPLRKQGLAPPRRTWGLASAEYHAFHHSDPDDAIFTFAESWAGYDRILEILHPRLFPLTAAGRARRLAAGSANTTRAGNVSGAAR